METKPTFKNLMNLDKQKLVKDRSRSKSPVNRSLNKSANKSINRSINKSKRQTDTISNIQSRLQNTINSKYSTTKSVSNLPNSNQRIMQQIPQHQFVHPHAQKVNQIESKIQRFQGSFKNLEYKLNQMFNDNSSIDRFKNEQTQILTESRLDFSQRMNRLQDKLNKPLFPYESLQQQLIKKIVQANNPNTQPSLGQSIKNFRTQYKYRQSQLNLNKLNQRLARLQSLTN